MKDRVRHVDVEKLSSEQAEILSAQIGEKLREIVDKACGDANRIVNIYGMKCKMQFVLEPLKAQETESKGE